MSLAINVTTSSGMVIATDSRQSYRNRKGMARVGSDNAMKLFQISEKVGCAITGLAFLTEDGLLRNISSFIDEFKKKEDVERMEVKKVSESISKFFAEKMDLQNQVDKLEEVIKKNLAEKELQLVGDFRIDDDESALVFKSKDKSGKENENLVKIEGLNILIGGFNHDGSYEVFSAGIPGKINVKRDSRDKNIKYGAGWIGQTDVTSRIILGWDGRIFNLPFVGEFVKNKGEEEVIKQLRGLEYQINWGTMTLQDAINFCVLAIKTTEAIQGFSDGIQLDPGDIPGVGGAVDVAVITRDVGFKWVKKKGISSDMILDIA